MQTQFVLLFLTLLAAVYAVKLEETIPRGHEDVIPQGGDGDTLPGDNPLEMEGVGEVEDDAAQILEELERDIFDQVEPAGTPLPNPGPSPHHHATSSRRCCKLGRRVAEHSLFCRLDFLQVQKRPNVVHRRKMKFHGPVVNGKTAYKDLMRRAEKCSLTKATESMFVKCCEWQQDIMYDLEQCELLATLNERRRCRRRVNARE